MTQEKILRLQLLGALILIGRFLWECIQAAGFCMWSLPRPVEDDQRQAMPPLSLSPTEQLTWSGLLWHLGRRKPPSGTHGEALLP